MRNTAFLAFGLGLILIQSNLFRLVGYGVVLQQTLFGEMTIAGITPSLA